MGRSLPKDWLDRLKKSVGLPDVRFAHKIVRTARDEDAYATPTEELQDMYCFEIHDVAKLLKKRRAEIESAARAKVEAECAQRTVEAVEAARREVLASIVRYREERCYDVDEIDDLLDYLKPQS